ncbi:MAG: hypothetical protein H7Z40_22865 [Phycisphaerae bacterium]|nr:hypothetical protein [Gemmatimonadaceae bacterium]
MEGTTAGIIHRFGIGSIAMGTTDAGAGAGSIGVGDGLIASPPAAAATQCTITIVTTPTVLRKTAFRKTALWNGLVA